MTWLDEVAKRTENAGEFIVSWNPHRSCYLTVEEHLEYDLEDAHRQGREEWRAAGFEPDSEWQRTKDTQQFCELQWYNATPVGFWSIRAPDLESLGRCVMAHIAWMDSHAG